MYRAGKVAWSARTSWPPRPVATPGEPTGWAEESLKLKRRSESVRTLKRSTEEGAKTSFWKRAVVAAELVVVPDELVLAARLEVELELVFVVEMTVVEEVELLNGCTELGRQVMVLAKRAAAVKSDVEKCILKCSAPPTCAGTMGVDFENLGLEPMICKNRQGNNEGA